jgi:hypothetical protein
MMPHDDFLVLFSVTGFLGFINPRFGFFALMICSVAKFFGG